MSASARNIRYGALVAVPVVVLGIGWSLAGPATARSHDKNARTHLAPATDPLAGDSRGISPNILLATRAPVPKEVESPFMKAAREKAIGFLKQKQTKAGTWEHGIGIPQFAAFEGGLTALVVVALLEAGVAIDDPAITKAVEYLAQLPLKKTYVVSLQTQALARAAPKKHADQIQKNVDWLLDRANGFKKDGPLLGWTYADGAGADGSNTHFAVFALHVAAQAGAKVDGKIWKEIRDHYVRTQRDDGWAYTNVPGGPTTYSMTAAGLIGLALADQHDKTGKTGKDAYANGMSRMLGMSVEKPPRTGYRLMLTAELGRTMQTLVFKSGEKELAWYRDGATTLLKEQLPNGSWAGDGYESDRVLATAFRLYFLGRSAEKK